MSKLVDLTAKMEIGDFRPEIKVSDDLTVKVNNDAKTTLKVLAMLSEEFTPEAYLTLCETLFSKEDTEKLNALDMSYDSFQLIITTAVNLIANVDDSKN